MAKVRVARSTRDEWNVFTMLDDSDPMCLVEQQIGRIRRERGHFVVFVADWSEPGEVALHPMDPVEFADLTTAAHALLEVNE